MNDELNDLYQQVILDHNKNPRNFGKLDPHTHSADGHNPLCGDQIEVQLLIDGDIIKDVMFNGNGCAISKASASIMTTLIKGKNLDEAKQYFDEFHDVITADMDKEIDLDSMGKIAVFAGVREFPSRIKCANLAWHTMNNAIHGKNETATTDDGEGGECQINH